MAKIEAGKAAPKFTLKNQDGEEVSLKDFAGKQVVLYFYPKDLTPGCTTEACDFNTRLAKLKKRNAVVLGVSKDPVKQHKKFAEKYGLDFSLLADEDGKVSEAYGVWKEKSMYGRKYMGIARTTFLIDEKGKVSEVWEDVKVKGHADAVLERIP